MDTSENMRIWEALGKTDPAATKQFIRSGGFKGTAISPMWANLQMTEFFGPCGSGWGQGKPEYQVVEAGGEVLVYCTVELWYREPGIPAHRYSVFGVGGDKVVTQVFMKDGKGQKIVDEAKGGYKTYPQTDDEAFKKAYTDALSNAMKFIGVAADVHMGLFDDNKYVQQVGKEFDEEKKAAVIAEVRRQMGEKIRPEVEHVPHQAYHSERGLGCDSSTELDWSYNKSSGLLICRPVSVKLGKTKDGKRDVIAVKLNQSIDGKDMASYFHSSHKDELLQAAGKVCKFLTLKKGDYVNIDGIMEIDGHKVDTAKSAAKGPELTATLTASALGYDEEGLREFFSTKGEGSWDKTLQLLRQEKAAKDGESSADTQESVWGSV